MNEVFQDEQRLAQEARNVLNSRNIQSQERNLNRFEIFRNYVVYPFDMSWTLFRTYFLRVFA